MSSLNLDRISRIPQLVCLFVVCCFGGFLFDPTNRPLKYTIFALALCSIISVIPKQNTKELFKLYSHFIFPWFPWFFCIFLVFIVNGGQYFYFDSFLLLSLIFLALQRIDIKREWVLYAISITAFLISSAVLIQLFFYLTFVPAEILGVNKNVLIPGLTLLTICCIAALFFPYTAISKRLKAFLICSTTVSLGAIVSAEVRTSLLAILSLLPIILIYKEKDRWKYISVILIAFSIMFALLWFSGRIQEGIHDLTIYKAGNPNSSWGIRLELWKLAITASASHPFFGWGAQPFESIIHSGFSFPVTTFHARHFHNDFFNILVCTGLVGVIGWLISAILLLKNALKKDPVAFSLLIASFAMGLTERIWFQNRVSIYLFATLWVLLYLSRKSTSNQNSCGL